jgi:accessory colonization factor AcfC
MEFNVYCVWDNAAKVFKEPFYKGRDEEAIRDFTDAVNDERTILNKHPMDYNLYKIGVYEDNSGKLSNGEGIVLLEHGINCLKRTGKNGFKKVEEEISDPGTEIEKVN